jgi:hypothetical protein
MSAPAPRATKRSDLIRDALLVQLALIATSAGCQLAESEVVERKPDAGVMADGPALFDDADALAYAQPDVRSQARDAPSDRWIGRADTGGTSEDDPDAGIGVGDGGQREDLGLPAPDGGPAPGTACAQLGPGDVFCDDFEHGADRWATAGMPWAITTSGASVADNHVFQPEQPAATSAYVKDGAWADVTVTAKVSVSSFGQASGANRAEVYARYQDETTFWALSVGGDDKLSLRDGSTIVGTTADIPDVEDGWHTLAIKVTGPLDRTTLEGYLDGKLKVTWVGASARATTPTGSIGLGVYGVTKAAFDDVRVSTP